MRHGRARACYWITGFLVTAVCAVAATACSGTSTLSSWTPIVSHERILLVPPENAGWAGWCMKTGSTLISGCGAYARARPPILAETWSGHGEGPSEVIQGFALTTSEVAYVVLKGRRIPTRAEPMLPERLREVVIDFRGKGAGSGEPFPTMWPLNAQGHIMPTRRGQPLLIRSEPIRFSNGNHPAAGACRIEAEPIVGLVVGGGSVVASVHSYPNLVGQAFQACADSSYAINGQHLLATVLLSAATPGSTPASLPAALPLSGYPGIFYEPEVEGNETLAKRIGSAWLVVSKGESRQQRLQLLEHLSATVHLSNSPSV
jgi:hypothetical protein